MTRRNFISASAALAAGIGLPRGLSAGGRPAFGFDAAKCRVNGKFAGNPLFSGEPVCGVNLGFMARRGYFAREDVRRMPREMAESGVNWCILNTHFCQEEYSSRKLFFDPVFSSGELELVDIVKRLHDEGIHVILKPCLTTLDGSWMGAVTFPGGKQIEGVDKAQRYAGEWFSSFREVLKCFADFSSRNDIKAVLVGAEYTGTIWETDEWRKTIAEFRKNYDGPLSYEFTRNPEPSGKGNEGYSEWRAKIPFVDDLDFLSLSWYPRGRPFKGEGEIPKCPKTTLNEMLDYLRPAREQFDKTVEMYGGKPVLFTEIGQRSSRGCVSLPWDAWTDGIYDAQEQADYMEAIFRTFSDKPQWAGLCWWKWDETQKRPHFDPDPRKDRGFRIYGKPACDVLRKWSGRA